MPASIWRCIASRWPDCRGCCTAPISPRVIKLDGGFAGLFQLDFASPLFARRYENPVLVSCTDGVGTKLKVAQKLGAHDTVGIDLVAMSVNDALCCGAEPLFFLDYVAMSHDDPGLLEQIVEGISAGCVEADSALLGGETAIMPDLYARGDYDLAGFCVGVVERTKLIDGRAISPDDVVLGVASSGLHSNGYSLARRVVFDIAGLAVDAVVDELGETVGQALIRPTRIYVRPLRRVLNYYKVKSVVHGIAHITGGGLRENLERDFARGSAGSHRSPRVADSADLSLAAAAGRNRRRRDGHRLQHGRRHGAGRQPLLRRQHSPSTGRRRRRELADRPRRSGRARRRLGVARRPAKPDGSIAGCRRARQCAADRPPKLARCRARRAGLGQGVEQLALADDRPQDEDLAWPTGRKDGQQRNVVAVQISQHRLNLIRRRRPDCSNRPIAARRRWFRSACGRPRCRWRFSD